MNSYSKFLDEIYVDIEPKIKKPRIKMNDRGLRRQAIEEGIKIKSLYHRNWARKNREKINANKRAKYVSKKVPKDWVLESINKMV